MADAILEGKANAVQQVLDAVKGDADEFVEEGKGE
jgi:small subunit ribosomal protein S2